MAELTTIAATTTNSCCAPEAQATCCEPSAKAECCDPSHGEGCGCAADAVADERHSDGGRQTRESDLIRLQNSDLSPRGDRDASSARAA
jgi:hypothetical protein